MLSICRALGATRYINPIGGQSIYEARNFNDSGIELCFHRTSGIQYEQFGDIFRPHLSIIDVLAFNGKIGTSSLLDQYKLIDPAVNA